MINVETFVTERSDVHNLKDAITLLCGCRDKNIHYIEEDDRGKDIYHAFNTTVLVGAENISITGKNEDISITKRYLEEKLNLGLIPFTK